MGKLLIIFCTLAIVTIVTVLCIMFGVAPTLGKLGWSMGVIVFFLGLILWIERGIK